MPCHERTHALLARSPCAEVQRCSDGTLHLSVGPVTIRMEPDVFRALCLTLNEALPQLSAEAEADGVH